MAQPAVTVAISGIALTLAFFVWRLFNQARDLRMRYSGITDLVVLFINIAIFDFT